MTGVSEFHAEVAAIALQAADGHGFMLAGGNALLAHNIGSRRTMDVNLTTSAEGGVAAVRDAVVDALRTAGFHVERVDPFEGDEQELGYAGEMAARWAEWTVVRDRKQVTLQMIVDASTRAPVIMDLGPVRALEDVLGSKLIATLERADARDYIDLAEALTRYSPRQLWAWATALDPALSADDFAFVPLRLSELEDEAFTFYGLDADAVAQLRERFTAWPTPRQLDGPRRPGQDEDGSQ